MEFEDIYKWLSDKRQENRIEVECSLTQVTSIKNHGNEWYILVLQEDGNTQWQKV